MALSQTTVLKLYDSVIEDVISGVREAFMDEGVDEQLLQELKQIWTNKILLCKTIDLITNPHEQPLTQPTSQTTKSNNTKKNKAAAAAAAAVAAAVSETTRAINQNTSPAGSDSNSNIDSSQQSSGTVNGIINTTVKQASPTGAESEDEAQPGGLITMSTLALLDRNKMVPIQITLPAQLEIENSEERILTIQVPASALQDNHLQQILTGPIISSILTLPQQLASTVLQQHVLATLQQNHIKANNMALQIQLDGAVDTSDDEGSELSDDILDGEEDDDIDKDDEDDLDVEGRAEEEPLNSEDDVTDEGSLDLFDTDNVIVCQYDKITRSRNKWKFYLKDGIMNIGGKDYVFQKSNGDAEW